MSKSNNGDGKNNEKIISALSAMGFGKAAEIRPQEPSIPVLEPKDADSHLVHGESWELRWKDTPRPGETLTIGYYPDQHPWLGVFTSRNSEAEDQVAELLRENGWQVADEAEPEEEGVEDLCVLDNLALACQHLDRTVADPELDDKYRIVVRYCIKEIESVSSSIMTAQANGEEDESEDEE